MPALSVTQGLGGKPLGNSFTAGPVRHGPQKDG